MEITTLRWITGSDGAPCLEMRTASGDWIIVPYIDLAAQQANKEGD